MKIVKQLLNDMEAHYGSSVGDCTASHIDGHYHKVMIDINGNGRTYSTFPNNIEDHVHEINFHNFAIDPIDGHKHEIE